MQKNCIILASGNGSNALNLINRFYRGNTGSSLINISAVVSNVEGAPVIDKVKQTAPDIPLFTIPFASLSERKSFEDGLESIIRNYKIKYIILAGFMKILGASFIEKSSIPIVNIHPSLLPEHKGCDAIKKAYEAADVKTGITIHYVNEEVDGGEIILQKSIPIDRSLPLEELEKKIHELEHEYYPVVARNLCSGINSRKLF